MQNSVAERRKTLGLTQTELALAIAETLGATVEEIFGTVGSQEARCRRWV